MLLVVALLVISSVRITPSPAVSVTFPQAQAADFQRLEQAQPFRFEIPALPSADAECPVGPGLVQPPVVDPNAPTTDPQLQAVAAPSPQPARAKDVC